MFRTSIGATQASQWGAENNDLDFSNISFDDEEEDDATQVKSQPKPSIGKTLQDLAATPSSTKKIIHQPSHSEVNQSNDINNTNNKPSSSTPNQINTSSGDSPVLSLKASTTLPSTTSTNHKSPSSSSSSPVHPLLRTNELEVMDTDDEEENTLHAIKSTLVTPKARVVSPTSVVATNNSHSNHISPPILMKSTSSTINSTTTMTTTSKSALPTSTASTNILPTSTTSTTAATSHEPTTMNKQATKLASQTTNIIHTIHHATLMKPTSGQNSTDKSKTLPVMDEISSDDHSENENEESSLSAKKKTSSTTTSRSSSSSSKNQRINQSTTTTTTTTTMSSSSSTSNSQNQIKQVHDQQVRSEKLFKDLRFTVTSISTPTERERVIKAIRSHGGEVIETLEDIQEAEKIILIADDCTTKPNYLIALMMEIPLLKKEWIHDSISEGRLLVDSMYKYVLNRGSFLVRSTKQKKLVKQHVSSKLSCCVPMEERIFNSVKVRIIGSKDFKEKWTPILKAGGAKVMTVLKSQTDHLSNFLLVEDYDKLDAKVKKEAKQLKLPILDRDSLLEIIVTLERKLSSDQILNYSDLKSTVQKMAKKQTSKKRTLNDEDSESDSDDEEEVEHKKDSTVESSQEIEELVQRKKSKPSPSETKETTKSQETKQLSQTSKSSISQIGSNIESVVAEHVPKQKDATIKPKDTTSLESNSLANGFYFRKSEYESNSFSQLLQIHDQSMEVICVGDVVQTLDDKYYRVDSFGFSRLVATEYVLAQQTKDTFRLLHESDRKHVEIPLCAIRHKVFVSNSSGMGERIFLIERPERLSILDDTSLISVEHRAVNILKYNVNHEFLPAASQKIQILQFNNCLFQENDVVKIVCSLEEGSRMACVGRIRFVLEDRLFIEVFRRHPNSEISDHYVTSFTVIPFSIKSISIMEPLHSFNDISVFNSYKKHLTTHGVQSIFVQEE
ncbi:hypothetical protein C9374_000859 [Naegleria lovaniensis]|uniref:BRCT domain-containing protein n=1 Tax=Naegleria lovaniensis TaxID=51637 RepID=A0AA88GYH2_NAELO|nr:uncharacterized protein C9374_000859 [Naegleria lovaniensis]KAG2388009.1 hypothetical protein C9374_000859 [Naegleria lovaniensis]